MIIKKKKKYKKNKTNNVLHDQNEKFILKLSAILKHKLKLTKIVDHIPNYIDMKSVKLNVQFNAVLIDLNKDGLKLIPSFVKLYSGRNKIKPFWNNKIQTLSDKLFLPDVKYTYQTDVPKSLSNTWFDSKFYQGYGHLSNPCKRYESHNKVKEVTKAKKIKTYLNSNQRKYMKKIIGTYRYFYNRTVQVLNNYDKENKQSFYYIDPLDKHTKTIINIDNIYDIVELRKVLKNNYPEWIIENFNSHLISNAIIEALTRFKTCIGKTRKTGIPFEFKFKSCKNYKQTINIEKTSLIDKSLFKNWKIDNEYLFRNIKLSEQLPNNFCDFSFTWIKDLDRFYLNVPYKAKTKDINNKNKPICALDPNTVIFMALYSPTHIGEIGRKACQQLLKKCKTIDNLVSRINSKQYYYDGKKNNWIKITSEKRTELRKALRRRIEEIKDMKRELHNKTINYLVNNYSTIILPPFETQDMVGNLSSKTARSMYNLSFYEFKLKLRHKCKEYNVRLLEKSEHYTSKTCTKCGNIKYDLKLSDRLYECKKCNFVGNRDHAAARNILLKNMIYV